MIQFTQLVVEIVGTSVAVSSVFVTSLWGQAKDKRRQGIDAELSNLERNFRGRERSFTHSESRAQFAQLLLTILDSTHPPQQVMSVNMSVVLTNFLGSIADRYFAVTGDFPSEQQMVVWRGIGGRAEQRDPAAWKEFSDISLKLLMDYQKALVSLVGQRDRLRLEKSKLERAVERIRFTGAGTQILGIILVLLKDMVPK